MKYPLIEIRDVGYDRWPILRKRILWTSELGEICKPLVIATGSLEDPD